MKRSILWALGASVLLAGCNGAVISADSGASDTDTGLEDPTGDPDTVVLAGECPLDVRYGAFTVSAYVDEGYSIVDGAVADGVVPLTVREETGAQGECRLMKRNNPFCDGGCEADETCDFDGNCIPYPVDQDLGTVTVAGLAADVSMDPVSPGFTYFNTSLPHPAFSSGDLVALETGGGAFDPVSLVGVGVTLLEPSDPIWEIQEGQDLVLTWDAPTEETRAHVRLDLNIDQHGTSPVNVWCEFEDDGEGVVPAALIDQLLGAGVSGFPNGTLTRRTVDSAALSDGTGCMEFIVSSPRNGNIDVIGYTSCYDDRDCPEGQECNLALQICE